MAEFVEGVTQETSPPSVDDASNGAAAPAPLAPGTGTVEQSIPYSRFKEVIDARTQAAQEAAAWRARYEQLAQQSQRQAPAAPATSRSLPEGYDQAGNTLWDIISQHPKFQTLNQMLTAAPAFAQGLQSTQTLQQQYANDYVQSEHARLGDMAKTAGFPAAPQDVLILSHQVAGVIAADPNLQARFLQRDRGALDEAFAAVKNYHDQYRKAAAAQQQTVTAKQNLSRLPPRPGTGSPPGQPAPKAPTNERDFFREGSRRLQEALDAQG